MTLSRCLLIEIRAKHDQPIDWVGPTQPPVKGRRSVLDPTGDLSHQDPILPRHGMQRTANTLGLKVTAESKKNYIKKSCVVDIYRRMAG